ncbi:uncharacterized protein LOC111006990 [Momordica charantia]|uniref:Uncharacterized protein LOC111006990 n=1 Tax=Momordica charantia TaxID=3673 RepID=A0A6J1BZU3_MOMCH|nr:uncharacterized protein LOC111006990 [Momordica charantia]
MSTSAGRPGPIRQNPLGSSPSSAIPGHSIRRTAAFTTPQNYAGSLSRLLTLKGMDPLWCPTLTVQPTPHAIKSHILPPNLESFSAVAFTSRAGISALLDAATEIGEPLLPSQGETFLIAALGKDSELLDHGFISQICPNASRIQVVLPKIATPSGLVEALGVGNRRRVLCPVPRVVGLEEPPVVPNFLHDLEANGWVPVRVDAYETRWAGPGCARQLVERDEKLDAIVFTSTGEVEGLLKSLRDLGFEWETMRKRWPEMVVAAHGPVTAAGAERLGVKVDLVSCRFDSFNGVVDALHSRWQSLEQNPN